MVYNLLTLDLRFLFLFFKVIEIFARFIQSDQIKQKYMKVLLINKGNQSIMQCFYINSLCKTVELDVFISILPVRNCGYFSFSFLISILAFFFSFEVILLFSFPNFKQICRVSSINAGFFYRSSWKGHGRRKSVLVLTNWL